MNSSSSSETGDTRSLGTRTPLGRYELREPLGTGGLGQVWTAFDSQCDRHVVVKILPPEFLENNEAIGQVRATFRVTYALCHQHIGRPIELFTDPRHGPCLVMEFVRGQPLRQYARRYRKRHGSIPLGQVVRLLAPLAEALDYAHRKEILHQDIQPKNILVNADQDLAVIHVTLIDFGLAAGIQSTMSQHTKGKFRTLRTAPYMSPEQMRGNRCEWDGRTDQYALAVVAYELLAGNLPFEGPDEMTLMSAILNRPPSPIPQQLPAVNAALFRGLSKKRDDRFDGCREFVTALRNASPREAVPPPVPDVPGLEENVLYRSPLTEAPAAMVHRFG